MPNSEIDGELSNNRIKKNFLIGSKDNVKSILILKVCLIFKLKEFINIKDNLWMFSMSYIDILK